MKVLVLFTVVAIATSATTSNKRVTKAITEEDDGQYHEDNSGNYIGDNSAYNHDVNAQAKSGLYQGGPSQVSAYQETGVQSRPAQVIPSKQFSRTSYNTYNQDGDDGQYHPDPQEDDGQYHEDNSGDYYSDGLGGYTGNYENALPYRHVGSKVEPYRHTPDQLEPYRHVGSKVEPYRHTPDQLVPYKPYSDAGSYKQVPDNGNYKQVPDNGNYKQVPDSGNYKQVPDNGNYKQVPENGNYKQVPDNGNYKQGPDNGNYRQVGDNGAYGQYSGKSSFGQTSSYSGNSGSNVIPGKVGQHAGSSSVFGNQKVVGQSVVGPSFSKSFNQGQDNDGQYHPDNSGNYNQKAVADGKYTSGNEGQYNGQYSGKSSFGQTISYSGNSGPNVVPGKVGQQAGSSSIFGNQKVVGQSGVGTSFSKSFNQGQDNDGQYHPDNSGNYNQKAVADGKYTSGNEGQYNSQYSGKSSFGQTSSYSGNSGSNVIPGKVGQHAGSSSVFGNQKVVEQSVVGPSFSKSVNQGQDNDGQYHPDNSGNYNQKAVADGKYTSGNEGQYNSQYSGKSSFGQTSSYSGNSGSNVIPGKVGQHAGSSSVFGNQKVVEQSVVGPSFSKSVNQEQDNDGQYHPDNSGNYNQKAVADGKYSSGNEGQYNGQYSGKSSFGQTSSYSGNSGSNVVSGKVGQQAGSSSIFGNQKVVGQSVVGPSFSKSVNQGQINDGQYHADNSGNYNQKAVVNGKYSSGNEGQYNGQYSEKSSFGQTSSYSGNSGPNVVSGKVGQQTGSSSVFGNQKVVGQSVVGPSFSKSVNQGQENDGQYHPDNSGNYNEKSSGDGKYTSGNEGQYSGKSSFTQTSLYSGLSSPNVVPGKVNQQAGSSSVFGNQKVVGQSVVGPSFSKSVNQGQDNDGQYHPDNSGNYNQKAVADGKYSSGNEGQYNGQYSGKSSFGQTSSFSSNSGPNVVLEKLGQQAGSSSVFGKQKVVEQSLVAPSSGSVNQGLENDGQYNGQYSGKSSFGQTSLYSSNSGPNVVSGKVGQPASSSFVFGNQKVAGQSVVGTSLSKSVNQEQENDGQYHPDDSENYNQKSVADGKYSSGNDGQYNGQYSGKSSFGQTSLYSSNSGPNVVSGKVGKPASSSFVFGNQKVAEQSVVGTSLSKSVNQEQENDGQYHPDDSGNYNQKSVADGKYSSGNNGQYNGQYSGKSSFGQTSSYSGSSGPNVISGKVGQQTGSSSVFGNQNVVGQSVASPSFLKSVNQGQENDGQYHPDNTGNYNQKSVDDGKYTSGNGGQHSGQYSGKSSFTQTSSYSGSSSPNVVPGKVSQHSSSSSVFGNQNGIGQTVGPKVVGQTVGGPSPFRSVDQSATNDGQYRPDNTGNYNQKSVDDGKYTSGNGGQHSGQYSGRSSFTQSSSYSDSLSPNVVPGKVSQHSSSFSVFGNQNAVGQTVGPKVVGQTVGGPSPFRSIDQSATNDGQHRPDNTGNYNQKSVDDGKYTSGNGGQHSGQYSGKSSFTQTSSYSGSPSPNLVPGKVNQQAGSSSVFGNQKVFGQTVGGPSSYRSVDQSSTHDSQYHPDNSGNYNQKTSGDGKYTSGNEGQHAGQYSGKSSFTQTSSYSGLSSPNAVPGKLSQQAGSSSVFGNQKVFGQTVGQKVVGQTVGGPSSYRFVDQSSTHEGQYHPDNSGHYNQKSSGEGKYTSGNEGQHGGQYSGKSSFTQTSSYSGSPSPNVVPGQVSQHAGSFSVFDNTKVVGQSSVVPSSSRSVNQGQENDGQYHPDNSGNYNQKAVDVSQYSSKNVGPQAGRSSFSQTSSYSGSIGPNSLTLPSASKIGEGSGGSTFQSKTVSFQNNKPVQTGQSHFTSYSGVQSVQPGVQLHLQGFETVQSNGNAVPLSIKDMQLIHSKIQTILSSKYGKHNEKFDEKHFGVIRQTEEFTNDGYHYMYETEKGIIGEEEGHLVGKGTDKVYMEVKGFYSYTGPDSVMYSVEYSADSLNGYLLKYGTVVKMPKLPKGAKFCLTK